MDDINSDLILLESLSKKISDLIYDDNFNKISELDSLRQTLIKNIHLNKKNNVNIKHKLINLIKEYESMVLISEAKLKKLNTNHNKFNTILKAYSKVK